MILLAIILKIVSLHDLSLRAAWARHWTNRGRRKFSKTVLNDGYSLYQNENPILGVRAITKNHAALSTTIHEFITYLTSPSIVRTIMYFQLCNIVKLYYLQKVFVHTVFSNYFKHKI